MRPLANFTLHAVLAAALAAFAATSAAGVDPAVKPGTVVKIGSSDSRPAERENYFTITLQEGRTAAKQEGHKEQLQIESWQWGRVTKVDSFTMKQGVKPADPEQLDEWIADVARPDAKGDMTLKGSKIGENAPLPTGASETLTVGGARSEAQATGKRQHKPLTMQGYYDQSLDQPLARGALRVKVKMPWMACKVGTRFPELMLGGGATTYRLTDAVVTSCGPASGSRPMESISFNYSKIDY